jgi:diguanylate cyclase
MYVEVNMTQSDELTGLLTLQSFIEKLEDTYRAANTLVLVVLDIDHFMAFNTKYGHVAGDSWIKSIARLFEQTFQDEGVFLGRAGGDELMAAIPSMDQAENCLVKVFEQAEALRHRMEHDGPAITFEGADVRPGFLISLGLAAYPTNAADMTSLLEKGRQALYRAKAAGGNRVCFYQETDTLTGLLNAYATQRSLEEALANARQQGNQPVSLFLLDIDNFQKLNEEYGHRAGDEVLRRLGKILENNFQDTGLAENPGGEKKGTGLVGRIAGDAFLVILPGQRADSAFILAEEVRRLVEDSDLQVAFGAHTYALRFRISGGIATFPSDAVERVDLLRKADEALYRSKQTGRNRNSLPTAAQMITKTSYYTQIQLERLAALARKLDRTEAFLLREALDELLRRYDERGD